MPAKQIKKRYYPKVWDLILFYLMFMLTIDLISDFTITWYSLLANTIASTIIGSLVSFTTPIVLFENGVKSYTFWRKRHFLEWHEIEEVMTQQYLNVKCVAIFFKSGSQKILIPLNLRRGEDFKEKLSQFAPEGNVLREYFAEKE